jgi:glycosyltransferase involved in cell wall biosynthesis
MSPRTESQPRIAAVICTHNRAELLKRTLASLARQSLAPEDYEVVVIDNASTDGTAAAVQAADMGEAHLHYCFEPRLGLSIARNRGLAETDAPYVAFIDDDATADSGWIGALLSAIEAEPHPISVGGKIDLHLEAPLPPWLPKSSLSTLGQVDHGPEPHACDYPREALYCSNLAFDRQRLLDEGGFNLRLGRTGKNLISNEELDVLNRLQARGGLIFYEPRALVHHYVPKQRLNMIWHLRRTFSQGMSDVLAPKYETRATSVSKPPARNYALRILDSGSALSRLVPLSPDGSVSSSSSTSVGTTSKALRMP